MNTAQTAGTHFGWTSIARLGLIQACLGGVVVLATSTLNRILVVELALAAVIPGLLVALHYAVQILRPRMGFGSDQAGRCTPFILGGMTVLATGGLLGAWAVVQIPEGLAWGLTLLTIAFFLIGLGVSACGTAVLVLLAKRVEGDRRAGAATMVWLFMIAGFAITAGTAGHYLDPYSEERLLLVAATITGLAVIATALLLWGLEGQAKEAVADQDADAEGETTSFRVALQQVWKESEARHFTIFVFVSMLAFSAQDLILEPFAGLV
ncbi:MAG: MFS transporter, partial [Burkholderiaceae bacterium]